MRILSKLIVLLLLGGLFSCAAAYKPIIPENLQYNHANASSNGLELGYRYNVLQQAGNNKYAKKEMKKGVQLVAVEITNTGYSTITFDEDVTLFANNLPIGITEPSFVFTQLKQTVPTYLLYLLLSPMQYYSYDSYGQLERSTPIGLIIGPGLALGNVIQASTANNNLKRQLERYNLKGKSIAPGETIYGLVGLIDSGSAPLGIRRISLESTR